MIHRPKLTLLLALATCRWQICQNAELIWRKLEKRVFRLAEIFQREVVRDGTKALQVSTHHH
jgi:hypothetical protein